MLIYRIWLPRCPPPPPAFALSVLSLLQGSLSTEGRDGRDIQSRAKCAKVSCSLFDDCGTLHLFPLLREETSQMTLKQGTDLCAWNNVIKSQLFSCYIMCLFVCLFVFHSTMRALGI